MIVERVDLDKVKLSTRKVSPDSLKDLAADIKKHGQLQPLILRPDMVVLEGVRRVLALRMLKVTQADAIISDDFDAICDYLHEAHKGRDRSFYTLRRLNEAHEAFLPLIKLRQDRTKMNGPWSGEKNPYGPTREARILVGYALRVHPPSLVERSRRLFSREGYNEEIDVLCEQVDANEITISQALARMDKMFTTLRGAISDPVEQRKLITGVARSLLLNTNQLSNLAEPIKIPLDEFKGLIIELRKARKALSGAINHLERQLNG